MVLVEVIDLKTGEDTLIKLVLVKDYFQGSDGWNHSWNIDMMNRACLHDPYDVSMNYEHCGICTVGVCTRNSVIIVQGSRF